MTCNDILDGWRLHQDDYSVVINWEPPFLTFLTEKTEENRQFEWFYVNISVVKVGQNDL